MNKNENENEKKIVWKNEELFFGNAWKELSLRERFEEQTKDFENKDFKNQKEIVLGIFKYCLRVLNPIIDNVIDLNILKYSKELKVQIENTISTIDKETVSMEKFLDDLHSIIYTGGEDADKEYKKITMIDKNPFLADVVGNGGVKEVFNKNMENFWKLDKDQKKSAMKIFSEGIIAILRDEIERIGKLPDTNEKFKKGRENDMIGNLTSFLGGIITEVEELSNFGEEIDEEKIKEVFEYFYRILNNKEYNEKDN